MSEKDGTMERSDDIANKLIYGSEDDIKNLLCDCGGKIMFNYLPKNHSMKFFCEKCNILVSLQGIPKPNCVEFFGNTNMD